jgi:hypothetical protein
MATKITLVTGKSIQLRHELDEAVSEVNPALAAGSLMSVNGACGGGVLDQPGADRARRRDRRSVVVAASADRPSHRSQDCETEPDHEQDRSDDDQEVDAGDEEPNDEQDDAECDHVSLRVMG